MKLKTFYNRFLGVEDMFKLSIEDIRNIFFYLLQKFRH